MTCPLCNSTNKEIEIVAGKRNFHLCSNCGLIFCEEKYRLSAEEEKKRYSYHQNSIDDKAYTDFLNQIIEPTIQLFNNSAKGLDYGCGPNPVLANLLEQKGFKCDYYDPYFFPDIDWDKKYDFIFATECFEHFFSPAVEIERICNMLIPGGILAVMTELWFDLSKFPDWYYIKDPTHVCFYNSQSFDEICKIYGLEIVFCDGKRVVVMRKKSIIV